MLVERTRYELSVPMPPEQVVAALVAFGPERAGTTGAMRRR